MRKICRLKVFCSAIEAPAHVPSINVAAAFFHGCTGCFHVIEPISSRALPAESLNVLRMLLRLKSFLLAHSCAFCGQGTRTQRVCDSCLQILPWNAVFCPCCGQPVAADSAPDVLCAACQQRLPAYYRARSAFRYAFPIDSALKALKFSRQLIYAPALAELLLPTFNAFFADTDVLIPVPLHRRRHVLRGFNQSAEICRTLAKHTGRPVSEQAVRQRHTATQSGLTAPARRRNLRNAFKVRGTLTGSQPLIVDDVITTGTTCETLARALLAAGAVRVGVLTIARSSFRVLQ